MCCPEVVVAANSWPVSIPKHKHSGIDASMGSCKTSPQPDMSILHASANCGSGHIDLDRQSGIYSDLCANAAYQIWTQCMQNHRAGAFPFVC